MKNNRIKFILGLCLFTILISAFCVYAEDLPVSVSQEDYKIVITGDCGDNKAVSMICIYPSKELTLKKDESVDVSEEVCALAVIEAEDGVFRKEINIGEDGPFGLYTVNVRIGKEVYTETVRFTKSAEQSFEELMSALSVSENYAETILAFEDIGLVDKGKLSLISDELKLYFNELIKDDVENNEGIDAFWSAVAEAEKLVYALDDLNKASDEEEFYTKVKENSTLLGIVFDVSKTSAKEFIFDIYQTLPLYTTDSYKAMNTDYILSELNNSSWGGYEDIINEYDMIGIDLEKELEDLSSKQKDYLFGELAKEAPFDDIKDFCNKFASAKEEAEDYIPASKPSGGGSGGGSGKKSGGSVSIPGSSPVTEIKQEAPVQTGFADLDGYDWAKEAINCLLSKNIVSGVGENKFNPGGNIKREEFVKIIINAFDYAVVSGKPAFSDCERDSWYENYIYTASQEGLVSGMSEEIFGVGENITREDAVVIISRVLEKKKINLGITSDGTEPADIEKVSAYAKDAVTNMFISRVLSGNEKGEFMPKEHLTRAQAAKIIFGVLQR